MLLLSPFPHHNRLEVFPTSVARGRELVKPTLSVGALGCVARVGHPGRGAPGPRAPLGRSPLGRAAVASAVAWLLCFGTGRRSLREEAAVVSSRQGQPGHVPGKQNLSGITFHGLHFFYPKGHLFWVSFSLPCKRNSLKHGEENAFIFRLCSGCLQESQALPEGGRGILSLLLFQSQIFIRFSIYLYFFKVLHWIMEVSRQNWKAIWYNCHGDGWDFRLIFYWVWILKFLNLWIGWEGHVFHMSIDHKFFLSFKQFALCLCSIPSLGAEHSAHWGSWSLVSRGLIKTIFINLGDEKQSPSGNTDPCSLWPEFYSGILSWWGGVGVVIYE